MKNRTKTYKIMIALLLAIAMLFPSMVQAAHAFEGHEHKSCGDVTTHLHEKEIDCEINKFHFSSFHFQPLTYFKVGQSAISTAIPSVYKSIYFTNTQETKRLRGPPIFY